MKYDCDVSVVDVAVGEIDRTLLANIVIISDFAIVVWFVVHTALQKLWIKRETVTSQAELVDMTDFAVRIKKLP